MKDILRFLSKPENFEAIINSMPAAKLDRYRNQVHHRRALACFAGRKIIMCSADEQGIFEIDRLICSDLTILNGEAFITVTSRVTNQPIKIGYEPVEILDYELWLSLAPQMTLTWSAGEDRNGHIERAFLYGVIAHTTTSSTRLSVGDVVALTPKEFEELKVSV